MLQKVRNMIAAFDLDVFLIDPIQLGLQDLSNDSVKEFMDSILKVAKQTDCSFILVSHTRKPADDKPHSVSEYDLLGSSAINQVAFNTVLLSRDKMAEDENERNTTHLKLVKCRRTGNTGQAGYLRFDKETFHFKEVFLDTITEDEDEWDVG
jgi:twinkle protein